MASASNPSAAARSISAGVEYGIGSAGSSAVCVWNSTFSTPQAGLHNPCRGRGRKNGGVFQRAAAKSRAGRTFVRCRCFLRPLAAFLLQASPRIEPPLDFLFVTALGRPVVRAALERRRQAFHRRNRVLLVMGVLVVLPVMQVLH